MSYQLCSVATYLLYMLYTSTLAICVQLSCLYIRVFVTVLAVTVSVMREQELLLMV